jgi:hypothetical protein
VLTILVSGCGLSWSKQNKPSWVKVLQLCKVPIKDIGGPAVSNEYILNRLIKYVYEQDHIDHVICQLTGTDKLDIEINDERYDKLVKNDSIRNFTHEGLWPSSSSDDNQIKKDYYKWIYSRNIDIENTIIKIFTLNELCNKKHIPITFIQGYHITWPNSKLLDNVNMDKNFNIYDYYMASDYWKLHDHKNMNSVPCVEFMKHYAFKINSEILHFNLDKHMKKFIW